jgi:Tol biopolymer transport system component
VARRAVVLAVIVICVAGPGGSAPARPVGIAGTIVFDARPDARDAFGWQLFVGELATGRVERLVRIEGTVSPSWSPAGSELVYERAQSFARCDSPACAQAWRVDAKGERRRRLTSQLRRSESPDWGSTGRIAFVRWLPTPGAELETEIFTIESEPGGSPRRGLRRLTKSRGEDDDPAWSPDSRQIAFSSGRGGNFEIYVMDGDGANVRRLTNTRTADEYGPAWSPDGTRIAFWRRNGGIDAIVVVNVDGSGERRLSAPRESARSPGWSPGGEYIAYIRDTSTLDQAEIWVMTAAGSGKRKLIDGPYSEPSELDWVSGTP